MRLQKSPQTDNPSTLKNFAITKGYWLKVGTLQIEDRLNAIPPQFVQDTLNPNKFEIFYDDGTSKQAAAEECKGLERVAVWTPEGIQERLNDYYAGRKNYFVEKSFSLTFCRY